MLSGITFENSFVAAFGRFFGNLTEAYEMIWTAIELPLDLVGVLPVLFGSAVSIVVFVMVVKLILGR